MGAGTVAASETTPPGPGGAEGANLQDLPQTQSQKRSFGWSNNHSNIYKGSFYRQYVFPAITFAKPVFSNLYLCRSDVFGLQLRRSTVSGRSGFPPASSALSGNFLRPVSSYLQQHHLCVGKPKLFKTPLEALQRMFNQNQSSILVPLVTQPAKQPEAIVYIRQRKSHQLVEEQTHPAKTEVSEPNQVSKTVHSSQEEMAKLQALEKRVDAWEAKEFKARLQALEARVDAWVTRRDGRVAGQTRLYEALESPMEVQGKQQPVQENTELTIGVVSPHITQVVAIEDTLGHKDENIDGFTVKVKSVDGFQSCEENIIIISIVRSNIGGSIGSLSKPQRINISPTGDRHCLWIFGILRARLLPLSPFSCGPFPVVGAYLIFSGNEMAATSKPISSEKEVVLLRPGISMHTQWKG
ncbi:hypothetical protein JRO89_XS09G0130600 [Xanthoceras sorbifolium]|uniref:DNA2/NAM7 helicase-like C-terminal domain-containing protein n=1 Tax=Xanthoceras sorbifolium TaxID=99658 RepID=A0ABQ8HLF6_9ROSI|nr:hypothetical protein JRO89_XS09G0130600 [Xanthoceras sorbifolium]